LERSAAVNHRPTMQETPDFSDLLGFDRFTIFTDLDSLGIA
jgi:hypothetical protein